MRYVFVPSFIFKNHRLNADLCADERDNPGFDVLPVGDVFYKASQMSAIGILFSKKLFFLKLFHILCGNDISIKRGDH